MQLRGQRLNPLLSFFRITRGNAEALSLGERVGTIENGRDADLVVLDSHATEAGKIRMETVDSPIGELFLLATIGDDRQVVETYVAGKPMKSSLPQRAASA
jgi:guanine deaminase